jgi:hypothetical protein
MFGQLSLLKNKMIITRSDFQKGFEKLAGFSLKKNKKNNNSMTIKVGYQIIF